MFTTFGSNLCACTAAGICGFRRWVSTTSQRNEVSSHSREDCLIYSALRQHDPPLLKKAPQLHHTGPHFSSKKRLPEKPLTDAQRKKKQLWQEKDEQDQAAYIAACKKRADKATARNRSGLSSHAEEERKQQERDELEQQKRRKSLSELHTILRMCPQAFGTRDWSKVKTSSPETSTPANTPLPV